MSPNVGRALAVAVLGGLVAAGAVMLLYGLVQLWVRNQ